MKLKEKIDTSAEHAQKSAKYIQGWHERGLPPPIGTCCEIGLEDTWTPCFIVGASTDGHIVAEIGPNTFFDADGLQFRPLRSERNVLANIVEECSLHPVDEDYAFAVADAILKTGFKLYRGRK